MPAWLTSVAGVAASAFRCARCQPCPHTVAGRPSRLPRGVTSGKAHVQGCFACLQISAPCLALACPPQEMRFPSGADVGCALRPRGWLCLAASAWRRVFPPHQPDPQNRPQHHRIFPPQSRLRVPFAPRTPSCPFSSLSVARRCRETLTGRPTKLSKPRSRTELRAADAKLHRPHTLEGCERAAVIAIVNHVFPNEKSRVLMRAHVPAAAKLLRHHMIFKKPYLF